jgi:hypothetical protein
MKTTKLTAYNLSQPLAKRISLDSIQERVKVFAMRGRAMAIRARIHSDIAPQVATLRAYEDFINSGHSTFKF